MQEKERPEEKFASRVMPPSSLTAHSPSATAFSAKAAPSAAFSEKAVTPLSPAIKVPTFVVETPKPSPLEPFDPRTGTYIDIPVVDNLYDEMYSLAGELIVVGGYWLQASFFQPHAAPPEQFAAKAQGGSPWQPQ